MIKRLAVLGVLSLTVIVSACGFQLRGSVSLPVGVEPIYIGGPSANSQLGIEVRNLLNGNDIALADTPEAANYRLIIIEQNRDTRTLSLGGGTTAAEYQLTESVNFELQNKQGETVLGPGELVQRSIMRNDPNRVLSSGEEQNILRREMLSNLAAQLARQLAAFNYQPASPAADATPAVSDEQP